MRADPAAAIVAARSPMATSFMTAWFRRYASRHFCAVRVAKGCLPAVEPGDAVIVYANHPSWWDPVLFALLHAHVLADRAGYGPMEARALARYGVLRRIGIFPIDPETRSGAAVFLRAAGGLLETPATALWITAQGTFRDPRDRPVRLRPGVAHLMRRHGRAVAIPLALELPFWNESAPEALARFGAPVRSKPGGGIAELNERLEAQLVATMDRLAEDAASRDPLRFENIIAGRAGVGGLYDAWRRARALLSGEPAHLAHGDVAATGGGAAP